MKKIIILLTLILMHLTVSAFAKAFPYAGDITAGVSGTDNNWDSYADFILPVVSKETSFIFINPRMSMTGNAIFESAANEFNIGIGFRRYSEKFLKDGAIAGLNFYYDVRNTSLGNNYQQAGAGLELLSKRFDARVNGYFPFGNDEYFLGKWYDALSGNHIAATYYYEVSMSGVDGELGFRIPLPSWAGELRAFGGYYYFDAGKADAIKGFKARAEYRPLNILRINYALYENKDLSGTGWQAGADIKLPFNLRKFLQGKNPFSGLWNYIKTRPLPLKDRIGEMVMRDMYVMVRESSIVHNNEKLLSESGAEYYFTVVKPGGTGDGTFENPASLENGALLSKTISGDNSVLLLLGGVYALNSTVDLSGYLARETLIIGPQEVEYRGGNLGKISAGNPLIEAAPGITAFKLDSADAESFLISSIEFSGTNNTGTGLEILNYDKNILVRNNSFSEFETGAKINNSSSSVVFYNNIFENNNTGAEISLNAAYFEANLFTGNTAQAVLLSSSIGAGIRYNAIENAGSASGITVSGGDSSIIESNEITGGSYGIYLSGSNLMNLTENIITGSTESGIYSYGDNEVSIYDNYIYGNEGKGISVVNSTDTAVSSNIVFDNNKDGIYFYGGTGHIVNLNEIHGNEENGLYAESVSDSLFSGNALTNNTIDGISLKNLSDSVVSENKISSSTASGIYLSDAINVDVSNNTLYYNETGILASGGNNIKISSNIADNNMEGIRASGITDFTALSNDVSSNTLGGMFFSDMNNAEIKSNFVQYNKGAGGIYVENLNDSMINANVASFNESAGITVSSSSNTSVVYNGFDNDGRGHGLYLTDSPGIKMTWNVFQTLGTSSYFGLYMQNNVTFDASESGSNRFFDSSYGGNVTNYETDVKAKDYFY